MKKRWPPNHGSISWGSSTGSSCLAKYKWQKQPFVQFPSSFYCLGRPAPHSFTAVVRDQRLPMKRFLKITTWSPKYWHCPLSTTWNWMDFLSYHSDRPESSESIFSQEEISGPPPEKRPLENPGICIFTKLLCVLTLQKHLAMDNLHESRCWTYWTPGKCRLPRKIWYLLSIWML